MLTQRRRHQEQKRGSTDSSISKRPLQQLHCIEKSDPKKKVFLHLFEILSTIPFLSGGKELVHKEAEG